jgi:hypothetical protein
MHMYDVEHNFQGGWALVAVGRGRRCSPCNRMPLYELNDRGFKRSVDDMAGP